MTTAKTRNRDPKRTFDPLDMLDTLPEFRPAATDEQRAAVYGLVARKFGVDSEAGRELIGMLDLRGEQS